METIKIINNSENHHKEKNKLDSLKSYWYPDRTADIHEVNKGYATWKTDKRLPFLFLISILISILSSLIIQERNEFKILYNFIKQQLINKSDHELFIDVLELTIGIVILIFCLTIYVLKRPNKIYLIDFTTFQPPDEFKIPHELFMEKTRNSKFFDEESIKFQEKLLYRTGLGNDTYFPPGILSNPPQLTMEQARKEAEMVMFGCLDQLFYRTGITPKDIDILIVNCSLFNPTPSLSSMIVNKYKMRTDIKTYNLSGMGCSAGIIAIDLAKDLLQIHKNCNAVVVSTENITQNWYTGNKKSMLISNTLFRMGGASILLSNKWIDRWRAKYKLIASVRVHKGSIDRAYKAVYQEEDENRKKGVSLSKELISVAGDALKSNLTIIGPIVLPWSEQIKFFLNLVHRKIHFLLYKEKKIPAYVPDFKKAFQHFCIHAGGRAIIDGLEENLKLEPYHVEPSRATLYRYGNTSSSSIWYELQYIELSGRMKKKDKVFQIALGSGFKCNSAVWQRIN
jgi:3-ketoacyl-CoA synthase